MRFDVDDPDIKPFRIFDHRMQASLYNNIRLGILRIANPLIITPQSLKNTRCYLYNDKWICVDLVMQEYPLVVWRDFKTQNRGIHEPIECKMHVYHIMAGRVAGTALYAMEDHINSTLNPG